MDTPKASSETSKTELPGGNAAEAENEKAGAEVSGAEVSATGATLAASQGHAVEPVSAATDANHTLKVFRFESLARCGEEVWIENDGQIYRLRRTRQGKLILTK